MNGMAPGAPGISPTWCSSAKEMVGCSLGASRLWFTIGGGILNEVYHPRVDIPQIRDLGFIVADGQGFWVEVKRAAQYTLDLAGPAVPAVCIVHRHERFELTLRIVPCAQRDALLIDVVLTGDPALRPYALLAPHLGGTGSDNRAEVAQHCGRKVLWAEQGPFALALCAVDEQQRDSWQRASAGYVGVSDGWQDFEHNGAMSWEYAGAGPGNVALLGELPRCCVLALGFASSTESAATLAISALMEPFEASWRRQVSSWSSWHAANAFYDPLCAGLPAICAQQLQISAMVLRAHQDKIYPGAMVASLSVPWGNTSDGRGGYHLVWPRDLVECASALLCVGAIREAKNALRYLLATQQADGHWNQNQWLGGKVYWQGIQLDEAAFPVLLATALHDRGELEGIHVRDMIARALAFIARNGPASDQDRWEEDAGINTFTLGTCIAALVCGAKFLEPAAAQRALQIADYWNARLEDWTAVCDTPLARHYGIRGYYVRVAPSLAIADRGAFDRTLPIKNWAIDPGLPASAQIGVDFLQLVRLGLRSATDPLIQDSVRLADAILKVDTPFGPCWHRYNDDGYGEHDNGNAYDGAGRGRAWPLLTGERGHFEIVLGNDPLPLIEAMARMASCGGMLPEQVWDSYDIPAHFLEFGRPTGSAMPLAWTHAEYIKLVASRALGRPVDLSEGVQERYAGRLPAITRAIWCEHAPIRELPSGANLTLALRRPGIFHWGVNGWRNVHDQATGAPELGLYCIDLDVAHLQAGDTINLTFRDQPSDAWIGQDFAINVVPGLK
jgi:glucoamylase